VIDCLDPEEDGEGHDGEIDDRLNELAIAEGDRRRIADRLTQHYGQLGEVDAADQQAQRWSDHITNKRRDDLAERRADDDPDRHVDDISPNGKGLELVEKAHLEFLFQKVIDRCVDRSIPPRVPRSGQA